jgi:exonuclease SbcC
MRPIKLELAGFTCFKEPQSIAFEDLELFAIQGQTGAGKSSILDAITYALYGQTARLGSKGLEALISQGASGMYVTLEFEVSPGERYRASRIWSKKASERQIRFERSESDKWVTAVEGVKVKDLNAAIEQAVGLDYDGFTRAILLPQGEFDRFLRGDASERRDLLKGLLSLHQFELMRERANNLARDLKASIEQKNFLLEGEYANATPDALNAVRVELETVTAKLASLTGSLEKTRSDLEVARETAKLSAQLSSVRETLAKLEQASKSASQASERAVLARRVAGVMPRLEASERSQQAERAARGELEKWTLARDQALALENAVVKQLQAAQEAARELPELEQQLDDARAAQPKMDRLKALKGGVSLEHDDPMPWSEDAMAGLERVAAQLKVFGRSRAELRELEQTVQDAHKRMTELTAELEVRQDEQRTCLEQGKEAKSRVDALERDLEAARRENLRAEITRGLKVGDDCPVCHTPLKVIPDFGPSRTPQLEDALRDARDERVKLLETYSSLGARIKAVQDGLERAKMEHEKIEGTRATRKLEVIEMRESFEAVLGEFDDPQVALEAQRTRLLAGLAQEIRAVTDGRDPNAIIKAVTARRKQLQQAELEAKEASEAARAASLEAKSALEAARSLFETRRDEAQARDLELESALREVGFSSATQVREAALPEAEITKLEALERQHREAINATRSDESRLLETLGGRVHNANQLRDLEEGLRNLEASQRETNRAHGQLEGQVKELERRIELVKALKREVAALGKKYDVYAQLALDLKGSEFQEFMLSQVQSELLGRASTIMREVTRERYQLSLLDGEYHVLDNWNGLEARSVKTLSGGESFIASLSLALALSDYLAGHRALGALFLDEGFGTLDAEALDAVASVLETIQTQGRMVGVITHVPSLAERLPNRLIVEKGTGSSRMHWET